MFTAEASVHGLRSLRYCCAVGIMDLEGGGRGGGKVVKWNGEGAPGEGSTKLLHVMAGCLNWYGGRRVLSLFGHVS